jgi:RNA polymerase II-associated factor 1
MAIDGTFFDLTGTHLDNFRHPDPKKKDLRVIEVSYDSGLHTEKQSYDILPDDETFGNPYFVIKYPERPSAAILAVCRSSPTVR